MQTKQTKLINTKYYVLFYVILLCLYVEAQNEDDKKAEILENENEQDGTGEYKFSFKTSNGIEREETGQLEEAGGPNEHYVVKGSYSYILPDGTYITMYYIADQNGYRVSQYPFGHISTVQEVAQVIVGGLPPAALASLVGK